MKKIFLIVLVMALALTVSVMAFAEEISDILSSDPAEPAVNEGEMIEADEPIEAIPAEDVPAEDVPVEDAPAADLPDNCIAVLTSDQLHENPGYDLEMLHAVLSNRIQFAYSSAVDEDGNCIYELPEELAEKYAGKKDWEHPLIIAYEGVGELDSTETIAIFYGTRDYPNGLNYVERVEIVTIEIPAGEIAYYDTQDENLLGFAILSATYGDMSVTFEYTELASLLG